MYTHSKLGSGDLATLGESSPQRGAGASAGSRRSDDAPRQLKVTEEEGAGSKACISLVQAAAAALWALVGGACVPQELGDAVVASLYCRGK